MKKDQYVETKSSFLSVQKDTALIVDKILSNKNILKLMTHTSPDWQNCPDLTPEEVKKFIEDKQIGCAPIVRVNGDKICYLRITYDDFVPNSTNPYYRDYYIFIKIICHVDNWELNNFELRPMRIAGEIDAMLNNARLSGIGVLNFIAADQDVYDNEFSGVTLRYLAVHGNEDKVNPLG